MRIAIFLILLLFTAQQLSAQNKISGRVVDAMNRLPLPDATVTIINPVDSAAMGFAVVDKTGLFEIKNLKKGSYVLGVTYTGYQPFTKNLDITLSQFTIDLDTIYLLSDTSMMQSVVVSAPPIKVNKDTVEFRAASFKTKPNATVEDLLKKLPGVEVAKDGSVTAQGEEITKIYVDGKEFFSNDPKLATKNLSSDMVESIQVFDDMSDQAKFTKIDDGSRKRTINIKLRKDRKHGVFGRSSFSAGTEDRYDASASVNAFNDKRQISVLGGGNNVNRLGFSSTDLTGGAGGGRGGGSAASAVPSGNTQSWSTGINYRDEWGSKINFSGNYFVSRTNTTNQTTSYRQSVFGTDSASYTNSSSNSSNINTSHRLGFRFEYFIDSMNSLLVTPVLTLQKTSNGSDQYQTIRATNAKVDYTAIKGESHRNNLRNSQNFTSDLLFRHRFNKPGRTFTIGWSTSLAPGDGHNYNTSPYHFSNADSTRDSLDDRRQYSTQLGHSFNNTISTSVTEMIDSSMIWEVNYAYTINKSTSDARTWDYNQLTQLYDSVDKLQTNYFQNQFTANRLGTNFRVKKEKYDFQLGGAVNFAALENLSNRAVTGKDSTMRQTYTNFFPNASFNFNPKPRTNLRFTYRGSTRAPSISQLQTVVDVSNSLYQRTGNPDLKQEFTHTFNLAYNVFNFSNYVYMNMNLSGNVVNNKIVNAISYVGNGVQLIRPENLNGARNIAFSGTLGIPLKKVTTGKHSPVNLNFTTSARYSRDVSKLGDSINYNYTNSLGERIHFTYFIQDKLDVTASGNFNYNAAQYSVQKNLNYTYFDQHYALDLTYTVFKRLMINSDFDYYINTGRAQGFNQPIPLWNAYISCLLFKKQNGEVRISGFDLLNQNKSINRTVGDNYVEDTYTKVLQRFFMVTFMYNFKTFKGGRPGPRNNGFKQY